MTKEELSEFCRDNSYEEVQKLATLDAFKVGEGNFTAIGGNIELKKNGKFITIGRFDNAAGLSKEYKFIAKES